MNDTEILDKVIEALTAQKGVMDAEDVCKVKGWVKAQRRNQSLAEYVESTNWYNADWEEQAITSLRRIVREEIIKVLRQK